VNDLHVKHPAADAYALNGGTVYTPYAYLAREKRFTTAELFAQYWFACAMGHHPTQAATLYRFACLPHFDQETS
jgi:hypothetical protein